MMAFLHNLGIVILVLGGAAAATTALTFISVKATERYGWKITIAGYAVLYVLAFTALLTWIRP